jgi:hypothetical protein
LKDILIEVTGTLGFFSGGLNKSPVGLVRMQILNSILVHLEFVEPKLKQMNSRISQVILRGTAVEKHRPCANMYLLLNARQSSTTQESKNSETWGESG